MSTFHFVNINNSVHQEIDNIRLVMSFIHNSVGKPNGLILVHSIEFTKSALDAHVSSSPMY